MSQFFILIDEERRQNAIRFLQGLNIAKQYCVEIKQYRKNRSTAQNRLYWSWLNVIANDTGHPAEELHEVFKARFLGGEMKTIWGESVTIPKSTTRLMTQEFTEYLNKIEAVAKAMGVHLPHPDDYRYIMTGEAA